MTTEEAINFINENRTNLSKEQLDKAVDDLQSMDIGSWAKKYNQLFSENTKGWYKLYKTTKDLPTRLRETFGSSDRENVFDKPKAVLDDVYRQEYQDVPREQFDETISKMKQFIDDEFRANQYMAARKRREKEMEKSMNPLISDYEKRRYIENPEEALFGEQAPAFGKAPNTRWGSMGDLALGTAGLAADVGTGIMKKTNPYAYGVSVGAGPAIRFVRDVAHKTPWATYEKDWIDILDERKNDVATNAAIEGITNWKQLGRMLGTFGEGKVAKALSNESAMKVMKNSVENFPSPSQLVKMKDSQVFKIIDDLPEGDFKNAMKQYSKDIFSVDKSGIIDELDRASKLIDIYENPNIADAITRMADKGYSIAPKIGERAYESKILTEPKLNKLEKAGASALKALDASKKYGSTPILKATGDARYSSQIDEDAERLKEWYIANYDRDWSFSPAFRPKPNEGLKYEAWVEWYKNKYGVEPEE